MKVHSSPRKQEFVKIIFPYYPFPELLTTSHAIHLLMNSMTHGDGSCGCHVNGSAFITWPSVHVFVRSRDDRWSSVIYTEYTWAVSMTTALSPSADEDMGYGWKLRKKLASRYCVRIILSMKYTIFFSVWQEVRENSCSYFPFWLIRGLLSQKFHFFHQERLENNEK